MTARLPLAILAALLLGVPSLGAETLPQQTALPEHQLKAEFVERFTRFIDWPPESSDSQMPFTICVLGRSPIAESLDAIAATRRIKDKPIVVRRLGGAEGVAGCHVVFIPRWQAPSLREVLSRTAHHPILTVGDTEGFADKGVIINFFAEGDRLRFEVNEPAAQRSGLRIGSLLLRLARVVRPETRR